MQTKTTSSKFPEIVAAVRAREEGLIAAVAALWIIGDALNAVCGRPGANGVNDKSHQIMGEIANELQRLNFKAYTLSMLRTLRRVAAAFPPVKRLTGVDWSIHLVAGDPATLGKLVDKLGVRLTVDKARTLVQRWKAEAAKEERDCHDDLDDQPTNPDVLRLMDDAEIAENDTCEIYNQLKRRVERLADELSTDNKKKCVAWCDKAIVAITAAKHACNRVPFAEAAE